MIKLENVIKEISKNEKLVKRIEKDKANGIRETTLDIIWAEVILTEEYKNSSFDEQRTVLNYDYMKKIVEAI